MCDPILAVCMPCPGAGRWLECRSLEPMIVIGYRSSTTVFVFAFPTSKIPQLLTYPVFGTSRLFSFLCRSPSPRPAQVDGGQSQSVSRPSSARQMSLDGATTPAPCSGTDSLARSPPLPPPPPPYILLKPCLNDWASKPECLLCLKGMEV